MSSPARSSRVRTTGRLECHSHDVTLADLAGASATRASHTPRHLACAASAAADVSPKLACRAQGGTLQARAAVGFRRGSGAGAGPGRKFGKGRLKLIQIEALQVERGGQPGRGERLGLRAQPGQLVRRRGSQQRVHLGCAAHRPHAATAAARRRLGTAGGQLRQQLVPTDAAADSEAAGAAHRCHQLLGHCRCQAHRVLVLCARRLRCGRQADIALIDRRTLEDRAACTSGVQSLSDRAEELA